MENRIVRVRVGNLIGLALAVFLAAGCQSDKTTFADVPDLPSAPVADAPGNPPTAQPPAASSPSPTGVTTQGVPPPAVGNGSQGDPSNEGIRGGETLHITFSDTVVPLPAMDEKVKDDGTITLMFDKNFHAAGKTPGELAREIRRTYVPDYYAQLTPSVIRDVMRTFYVDGEVKAPSKQLYTGPITVTQAIAACGGFTDFADQKHVKLIRANGRIEIVNCKKALTNPKLDPEVYPGDKIHVPRSWI